MKTLKNNQNPVMSIKISDIMNLQYKVQQNNEYSEDRSINFIVANHLTTKYGFYHKEIMWALYNYDAIDTERKFYAINIEVLKKLKYTNGIAFFKAVRCVVENSTITFDELYARKSRFTSVSRSIDRFQRRNKILATVVESSREDIACDYGSIKYFHVKNDSGVVPREGMQITIVREGYSFYCRKIDKCQDPHFTQLRSLINKYAS